MMISSLHLVLRFGFTITIWWCLLASRSVSSAASFVSTTRTTTIRSGNVGIGAPSSCPSAADGWNGRSKRPTYYCRYLHRMPLDDYRDTVSSLESVLQQVQESLTVSQDLIRRLVTLHNHALEDAPFDSYSNNNNSNNNNFIPRDPQPQPPHLPLSLQTALERARSTSQQLGRNALETEWAWWQVRQVAASMPNNYNAKDDETLPPQQQQSSRICPALLAHPSYRDSYGEFLLQKYKSSNHNNNNRENDSNSIVTYNNNNNSSSSTTTTSTTRQQLQIHAQTLQQSLQQLQSTVHDETLRLHEIEQRRAIRVQQLNQSYDWSSPN